MNSGCDNWAKGFGFHAMLAEALSDRDLYFIITSCLFSKSRLYKAVVKDEQLGKSSDVWPLGENNFQETLQKNDFGSLNR